MAGKTRAQPRRRKGSADRLSSGSRRKPQALQATDRDGRPVLVGTSVRVLVVDEALKKVVPPDEWQELTAMVGQTFRVDEIDEYGSAWVETAPVRDADGFTHTHRLALDSDEMRAVSKSRRRPTRG